MSVRMSKEVASLLGSVWGCLVGWPVSEGGFVL